jgi:hypothetical protein
VDLHRHAVKIVSRICAALGSMPAKRGTSLSWSSVTFIFWEEKKHVHKEGSH